MESDANPFLWWGLTVLPQVPVQEVPQPPPEQCQGLWEGIPSFWNMPRAFSGGFLQAGTQQEGLAHAGDDFIVCKQLLPLVQALLPSGPSATLGIGWFLPHFPFPEALIPPAPLT